MEILGKILGSQARVKIMRLFLLNSDIVFDNKNIAKRSRVDASALRRELRLLSAINFIKKKNSGWIYNSDFKYGEALGELLLSDTFDTETIISHFKKAGKIKLLLISGIFIKNKDARVDLLLVGDKLKKGKIEESIKKIEAEIGTEIIYATFETKEFLYRLDMYDKLVRDILDFPHEIILQGKELSTQILKKP